jgi:hypothetical protein
MEIMPLRLYRTAYQQSGEGIMEESDILLHVGRRFACLNAWG